ncbi:flagellar hook-basal body protein [Pleionea sp. CnH1-48]|uniref:flagellar hook-basal body protein n=1 Tax=Pleionea sp. CnH1-48 TaxID=2954494 RepID=UPI002097CA37|nr:flagellar hook basal-body protein [Pleionea sp. CnH1-48]MCO7223721.1 flagellar hook basal-body protein [Pleionea sp. CnH1-48]
MSDPILALLQSIRSDMSQVEVISQNVANITTPGYKTEKSSAVSFHHLVVNKGKPAINTMLDMSQGQLAPTENSSDLAIQGAGFFVVQDNGGQSLLLTRSLQLSTNSDGLLTTPDGKVIEGEGGPIVFQGGHLFVNEQGVVYENDNVIGQLKLVDIDNESLLKRRPAGRFYTVEENMIAATNFQVREGFLEQSNVSSSEQMVKLIELTKHVESSQRALVTLDQMLESGINKIGQR